jgi:hypothetical protein
MVSILVLGTAMVAADNGEHPDPAASKLLADARAARATWTNFPGFRAAVATNLDGHVSRGQVQVDADGTVQCQGLDEPAKSWVQHTLDSIVAHRLASSADESSACVFVDDVRDHPLGPAVRLLGDDLNSVERIRDRQFTEVNRQMGNERFAISVLENRANSEGKYLSVSFVVNFWDRRDGRFLRSEANHQTWTRVGDFDLPAVTLVITARGEPREKTGAQSVRQFTLSGHRALGVPGAVNGVPTTKAASP